MSQVRTILKAFLAGLVLAGALASPPALSQNTELPAELRGAKVYNLPQETKAGAPVENPVIYKDLAYNSIDFERLTLSLSLSVKPVDRSATIRRIFFQNVEASGIPVHVEPFEQEFKVSKKDVVDLPAPLKCVIIFSDLDSLQPVKGIVEKDTIRITGQTFIEVKLSVLEKLALRTKRLVLPVELNEEVPLHMFSDSPLLQMAAGKILDTLSDPSSQAALALARERLSKLSRDRTLESLGRASIYLIYCEYRLRNPASQAAEKFSESGTGFLASADGKLLTAKRVVQPWKFDPQIAFLISRYHLELDPGSYQVWAWPAGARAISADGQPDPQTASNTEQQTLRVVKTAPDRMENREQQDPDSGKSATLSLHAPGENDLALLQLRGSNFQPLLFADAKGNSEMPAALASFPFGLSQPQANLAITSVNAARKGALLSLDRHLNPGESGAPLLTPEGKALGICAGSNECVPISAARTLIQ